MLFKKIIKKFTLKKYELKNLNKIEIENVLGIDINQNLNNIIKKYKYLNNINNEQSNFYKSSKYNKELQYKALENIVNYKFENFDKLDKNEKDTLWLIKEEGLNRIMPIEMFNYSSKIDYFDHISDNYEISYMSLHKLNAIILTLTIGELIYYYFFN